MHQYYYIKGMEFAYDQISKELHDDICNRLLIIEIGLMQKEINPVETIASIAEVRKRVRNISHQLLAPDFDSIQLSTLIITYFEQIKKQNIINTSVYFDSNIDEITLSHFAMLQIFRIIQETTTNIIKHGNASEIYLTLRLNLKHLSITIEDNGVDFDPDKKSEGVGLQIIRERIIYLNGTIINNSCKNKGNIIDIQIPINGNTP